MYSPIVILFVPEFIVLKNTFANQQTLHVGSLAYGPRAMIGRAKWKPLELICSTKIFKQKQHYFSKEMGRD